MQPNQNRNETVLPSYWSKHPGGQTISLGALHLSPISNRVQIGDMPIFLRPMEFRLLHFFMTHPDQVHTREHLLDQIWGDWIVVGERTVDVHIRRLRATLQPFGLDKLVRTIHCRGYLFSATGNAAPATTFIN